MCVCCALRFPIFGELDLSLFCFACMVQMNACHLCIVVNASVCVRVLLCTYFGCKKIK